VDGSWQGRPGDAQAHVHPPGLAGHRRAVDVQGDLVPQAQANQQHPG